MLKALFLHLLLVIFFQNVVQGQQNRILDQSNTREGESIEYCITHKKINELLRNEEYKKSTEKEEINLQRILDDKAESKGIVYKIPIVFHVLHKNGVENISDEQIFDQLSILNRDFRLLNADAANVQSVFQGMPSDVKIEFVLATKAPNGACFKGITRTLNALSYDGTDGNAQVSAIVSGNDAYNGLWPGNKYLNVFIVAEASGAAGYTTNPVSWSANQMTNGIWILHGYVGSIGTSSFQTSRALTHEVGHWLALSHTWGSNNNPGNTLSCGTDDGVDDTPNCIGVTYCGLNVNSCTTIDTYFGMDQKDNVENFMDYSYCSKMFTQGQVDRMRAALSVQSTGRYNLWQDANLAATGATGTAYLCKAEFTSNKTSVCLGDSIVFKDDSYNKVTEWNWTFPGGIPAYSTQQDPVVVYNNPGFYAVTLNATDGTNSDAETKTAYVHVYPPSYSLPFYEGFENYSSLSGLVNWEVYNVGNNNTYAIDNTVGHSGNKCVRVANYGETGSNIDELIAAPVDLSSVASNGAQVTLSFRYAYRKKSISDLEYLKVLVSKNCGETWIQRKTISGNQLSELTSDTNWSPSSVADWTTVHMTNIINIYWVDNFRYKFRFEGNGGNNFYLDDINIYLGSQSDELVLGLAESGTVQELALYPNPTDQEVNLRFSVSKPLKTVIQIVDITGKVVQTNTIMAAEGSNLVMMDTSKLAAGAYMLTVKTGSAQKTLQFVVN